MAGGISRHLSAPATSFPVAGRLFPTLWIGERLERMTWEGKYFRMTRARGTELVQEARGQVGGQLAMWNSLPQSCESPTPNPKPQTPKPGAESATPALPSGRKVGETRPSLRQTSTHAQATPRLARALACGASSRCGCHACTIDSREAHEQTAEALWGRCGVKHRDKRQAGARH